MTDTIDDLRIVEIDPLTKPADIISEIRRTTAVTETVTGTRDTIHRILTGEDERLLVVIGPCSIHDAAAAREYAARLEEQRRRLADDLESSCVKPPGNTARRQTRHHPVTSTAH